MSSLDRTVVFVTEQCLRTVHPNLTDAGRCFVKNTTTSFLGNTCALLCYQCLLLRHVLDSGSRGGGRGGCKAAV
jgi:hypothetical protein